MKRIAIIGTRDTKIPLSTLANRFKMAIKKVYPDLVGSDLVITSGNAEGVEQVAYKFKDAKAMIYLPWDKYGSRVDGAHYLSVTPMHERIYGQTVLDMFPWMAEKTDALWKIVTRNMMIINGSKADKPVDAVFYWADDNNKGVPSGGTTYGVQYAKSLKIPTYNVSTMFPVKKEVASATSTSQIEDMEVQFNEI